MTDLSRLGFLASTTSAFSVATGAAALASPSPPGATVAAKPKLSAAVPFAFDRAAFAAILDRPQPHRQLAVPADYGRATVALSHFNNSLAAYADPHGFAAGPDSLHCAAVLYAGRSFLMVLDDAMWAKYRLGTLADEEMRPNDTTYRALWAAKTANPVVDFMQPLIASGLSFFVCNNSLSGFAFELALRAGNGASITREAVIAIHDELAAHFVANTMLVPAGVAAVNAAQEARFTYLP
jgi:intracellular sulfur oxidation DsrE/DsrF family protein